MPPLTTWGSPYLPARGMQAARCAGHRGGQRDVSGPGEREWELPTWTCPEELERGVPTFHSAPAPQSREGKVGGVPHTTDLELPFGEGCCLQCWAPSPFLPVCLNLPALGGGYSPDPAGQGKRRSLCASKSSRIQAASSRREVSWMYPPAPAFPRPQDTPEKMTPLLSICLPSIHPAPCFFPEWAELQPSRENDGIFCMWAWHRGSLRFFQNQPASVALSSTSTCDGQGGQTHQQIGLAAILDQQD